MKKINNDNDKYEKKNAEIAAKELFAKFTNKEALENLLGGDYKIESINTDNAKVNAVDKYKNTSGRWVDWGADSAAYKNVFSGTIVITYSQTVTAKANAVESKTNAVNAADNTNPVSYTHLRAHETDSYLVCRLLLEKKKKNTTNSVKL